MGFHKTTKSRSKFLPAFVLQKLKKKGDRIKEDFRRSNESPIKKILKLIRDCQMWFRTVGSQLEALKGFLNTSHGQRAFRSDSLWQIVQEAARFRTQRVVEGANSINDSVPEKPELIAEIQNLL